MGEDIETYEFKAKFGYADLTNKTYTIPVYDADGIVPAQIMTRTREINRALGGSSSTLEAANEYAEAMQETFLSSGGASLTRIISCETVATLEEVIYNG